MREIYPDFGNEFVSRFWEDGGGEFLGYEGCSSGISCFISRLWEGGFMIFEMMILILKKDYEDGDKKRK